MANYLITAETEDGDDYVVELVEDADSVKNAFELAQASYENAVGIRIYRIADGPKLVSFEQVTQTLMRVEADA